MDLSLSLPPRPLQSYPVTHKISVPGKKRLSLLSLSLSLSIISSPPTETTYLQPPLPTRLLPTLLLSFALGIPLLQEGANGGELSAVSRNSRDEAKNESTINSKRTKERGDRTVRAHQLDTFGRYFLLLRVLRNVNAHSSLSLSLSPPRIAVPSWILTQGNAVRSRAAELSAVERMRWDRGHRRGDSENGERRRRGAWLRRRRRGWRGKACCH